MKKILPLILLLICSNAFAWQLQNKTLEECIQETSLIVVGETIKVISEKESDFSGVGTEREIWIKASKILKGEAEDSELLIHFSDVHLEIEGEFDRSQEYVWFLDRQSSSKNEYGMKNFSSIFLKEDESKITRIIKDQDANEKASLNIYTIERVIDGESILLTGGEEVRLIGVDAPHYFGEVDDETFYMGDPTEEMLEELDKWDVDILTWSKMGKEAMGFVKKRLKKGDEIRLEFDVQERDKNGRLLAYVWRVEKYSMDFLSAVRRQSDPLRKHWKSDKDFGWSLHLFNGEVIRNGYAIPVTVSSNVKYADLFQKLYEEAKNQGRGLWAKPKQKLSREEVERILSHWFQEHDRDIVTRCKVSRDSIEEEKDHVKLNGVFCGSSTSFWINKDTKQVDCYIKYACLKEYGCKDIGTKICERE